MKTKPILITSVTLNLAVFVLAIAIVQHKGGWIWIESRVPFLGQEIQIPKPPWPSVDNRILLIGDSHLAIHRFAEYSPLPFSNRAVSGSRISDINLDRISGYPALVVVSTSTNDIQARAPLDIGQIQSALLRLFENIQAKWPDSQVVYISPPHPNVTLYEKFIRPNYPNINRPTPEQIDSIKDFVSATGVVVIQAKSSNLDGLHIDQESAISVADEIETMFRSVRPQVNAH